MTTQDSQKEVIKRQIYLVNILPELSKCLNGACLLVQSEKEKSISHLYTPSLRNGSLYSPLNSRILQ